MDASLKPQITMVDAFEVSGASTGPSKKNCLTQIAVNHPLYHSELNYEKHRQNLNFRMLRNAEGLHAPLKLSMELMAAEGVGRMPFLPSSNAQRDVLLGRDELIEFSDFLGTAEFSETIKQPHAIMEKYLGDPFK